MSNRTKSALWVAASVGLVLLAVCSIVGADETPHNQCAAAGGDCVTYLKQAGPVAYCQWAGGMAAAGAYWRQQGHAADEAIPLTFPRPLTAQEQAHVSKWLGYGYHSGFEPIDAGPHGYNECMKSYI
jgi:hypothetical protein